MLPVVEPLLIDGVFGGRSTYLVPGRRGITRAGAAAGGAASAGIDCCSCWLVSRLGRPSRRAGRSSWIVHAGTADNSVDGLRLTKMTYPSGRELNFDFGADGSLNDKLSRLARPVALSLPAGRAVSDGRLAWRQGALPWRP